MAAPSSSVTGLLYAFAAALAYGGLNAAIRFADAHMSVWHIILYRSLFGAVSMAGLARLAGVSILGRQRPTLLLMGLCGAGGITALTAALILLPIYEALVLCYLFPAFSALLSPWLTRDRVTRCDWLLIGTACSGAVLILWMGRLGGGLHVGHLLGLLSAFFLGLTFTLIRRTSAANSALTPFFYICTAGIAFSIVPIWFQVGRWTISAAGLPSLALVAVLATAAHLAGNKALAYLPSPRVGVILMSEVIFGAVIGLLIFGEPLSMRTIAGGMLIIGSGIGLNIRTAPRAANPPAPGTG